MQHVPKGRPTEHLLHIGLQTVNNKNIFGRYFVTRDFYNSEQPVRITKQLLIYIKDHFIYISNLSNYSALSLFVSNGKVNSK